MIKRLPWLRSRKKTDPEVPLRLPIACGPDSARKRLIRKLVHEKAEEVSRREGIDRREFMASACGMATTLYMINLVNGCASQHQADNRLGMSGRDGGRRRRGMSGSGRPARPVAEAARPRAAVMRRRNGRRRMRAGGGSGGSGTGGYGGITDAAMEDPDAAICALGDGGNELIIDMQSHFVNSDLDPIGAAACSTSRRPDHQRRAIRGSSARPAATQQRGACYDQQEYIDQIFMGSDTTIGVLSGISYSLGADGTNTGGFAVAEQRRAARRRDGTRGGVPQAHADPLHGHAE